MRHMMGTMLLLCGVLGAHLWGAVGGVPETPVPGRPWPRAWVLLQNDDFGIDDYCGLSAPRDDHRTGALQTGLRNGTMLFFADYSVMTDRWQAQRIDELTLSCGRLVDWPSGSVWGGTAECAFGLGARLSGDLGGEQIQDVLHDQISIERVEATYEDEDQVALLWASSEWSRVMPAEAAWRAGLSVSTRATATSTGELKSSLGVHALLQHDQLDLWCGLRAEGRGGDATSATKRCVRQVEDGLWLSYGVAVCRRVVFSGAYNWDSKESYGSFGVVWPALPAEVAAH